jgi:hypothetical protein
MFLNFLILKFSGRSAAGVLQQDLYTQLCCHDLTGAITSAQMWDALFGSM